MNNSGLDSSFNNVSSQFIIKYQEKEIPRPRKPEPKRYSSQQQCQKIKQYYRISQSVIEKPKANKSLGPPSYLKPTEASVSAKIDKAKSASNSQLAEQKKKQQLAKARSKSLEKEENTQPEPQYNRVPIQYYDERDNGCGADHIRARVIFRGYTPKNTYYCIKTLKPLNLRLRKGFFAQPATVQVRNQFQLKFESKFESGNLAAAARLSPVEYWLYMREDTNTHGLRQWYYFQVRNKKQMRVKFRIYKFRKSHSLYRQGMKPYVRVCKPSKNYLPSDWCQSGQKIKYEYDKSQRSFFLEFEYEFQEDNQEVEFAMLPPYTYTMLKEYLKKLEQISESALLGGKKSSLQVKTEPPEPLQEKQQEPSFQSKISIQVLGSTLAGLNIPYIQITTTKKPRERTRQAIFVMARTHPGQTNSNWALESFIDQILQTEQLRKCYDFFIVPMVNPDGVYFGNHRTSVIGQDLNRNFHSADLQAFPEVQAIQWAVKDLRKSHKIKFLIDLHGHSSRKNIFAYGDEYETNSREYLHTRILPKILNDSISSFKYDYCIFRDSKQKKNTARVYFSNKYKLNCITFEESYGLLEEGPMNIQTWRNFGVALADSLLQYATIYSTAKEHKLLEYLSEEIEKERQADERRLMRHKKILGIKDEIEQVVYQSQMQKFKAYQKSKESSLVHEEEPLAIYHSQTKRTEEIYEEQLPQNNLSEQGNQLIEQEVLSENFEEQCSSVAQSQLSSGDDDLQLLSEQLQVIKKDIVKIKNNKDGLKREKYNIAQNKLELFNNGYIPGDYLGSFRLHDHRSSMIPRIAKFQMKKKEDYVNNFKIKDNRSRDLIERQREERRIQIQNRFKKMQLPSIRR